jgi:hypothetical protein
VRKILRAARPPEVWSDSYSNTIQQRAFPCI